MSKKKRLQWINLLWAFLTESAIYLAGALLAAYLTLQGKIELSQCWVVLALGGFTGALFGAVVWGRKTPAGSWGIPLCGGLMAAMLLLGNLGYGESLYWPRLILLLGIMLGCICASLIKRREKRTPRKRVHL